jgi:hypothetical protein
MDHRDREPAAGSDGRGDRVDRAGEVVDVHQRHLAGGAVEGDAVPPLVDSGDVRHAIGDAERVLVLDRARPRDEFRGDVDAEDVGAASSLADVCW